MPGRGPQTFKKRQKEQERKERQMEKMARRHARKDAPRSSDEETTSEDGLSELTTQDAVIDVPEGNTSA